MLEDLVRNGMDVNEHERIFNFTIRDIYVRNGAFIVVLHNLQSVSSKMMVE